MDKPEHTLDCSECGRAAQPDENADDEWRCYSGGVGELLVFCPECAEREFADDPSARQLRGK